MSVRNASSSIYYGNIDAQKWSLVSVNKIPQAELCSSLSKARLQVVDQELLQYFFSSPCISYNKTFYLKLNKLVNFFLTHFTLVSMGPQPSPFLWQFRNRTVHKALLTHSLLNFTSGVFMIFGRKTCSLIEKEYLHQIFCKVKDQIKESKQFMQP